MQPVESAIRVKFMAKKLRPDQVAAWRRQLPDAAPCWGDCEFIFDPDERTYDWLVVYDDLSPLGEERFSTRGESLACPVEHTVLVTAEPSSIKCYGTDYCAQFDLVITHHEPWALKHRNRLYMQTGYPWFYGRGSQHFRLYDEMHQNPLAFKNRQISTVCSARMNPATLQRQRFEFTAFLEKAMPELERFGKGVRPLDDKAEVLDDFRYHVTIENDVAAHYFTEKLVDSFLGLALPFYYGCPNAADYFPPDSFIPIDIFDFEGSLEIIRRAIDEGAYERRLDALKEARRRVFEEHNLFALLSRVIEQRHAADRKPAAAGTRVLSRRAVRNRNPATFARSLWQKHQLKRAVRQRRVLQGKGGQK